MMKYFYFFLSLIVISCSTHTGVLEKQSEYPTIKSSSEYNSIGHCDTVLIEGVLTEYEPDHNGKGGGTQYFDFEIELRNNGTVPIHNSLVIESLYINKMVKVLGVLECGGINQTGIQNMNIKRLQKIISIERVK